jgi:hypothetical protein
MRIGDPIIIRARRSARIFHRVSEMGGDATRAVRRAKERVSRTHAGDGTFIVPFVRVVRVVSRASRRVVVRGRFAWRFAAARRLGATGVGAVIDFFVVFLCDDTRVVR